nr:MAG TPA: replisome organizer [Caudoviricetes sp.]
MANLPATHSIQLLQQVMQMADVKWIKITTDMFDNRKIKHLRRLPDGDSIVLIWVMLLTLAGRCNSGGMIFLTENIPYTPKMLADELDFEESTVQLALNAIERLGMIQTNDDGFLAVTGWAEHQNIDGMEKIREQNRLRKQRQREKERLLLDSPVKSRDSHATDIEEELELEKEKDVCITSNDVIRRTDVQQILEKWNTLGVAKVTKLVSGTNRDKMLKARIREYGVDTILQAIDSVKQSDFLMGKNKDGWTITFDWFIRPNNFPKVLDGNYNNKGSRKSTGRTEAVPSWCNDDLDKVERMLKIKTAGNNPEIAARAAALREKLGGDSA